MRLNTILTVLCSALSIGCGDSENEPLRIISDAAQNGKPIDLKSVAGGKWERLLVFPPYTTPAAIEKNLGAAWSGAGKSGIVERDDICLLLFVRGNTVIASAEIPRKMADFSSTKAVPVADAVFSWTGDGKLVQQIQ